MIKIETDKAIVVIDDDEIISAKKQKKTSADIKVEMLLNHLEAIDKCTHSQATVGHIFGVIRKFCEVAKKEIRDLRDD